MHARVPYNFNQLWTFVLGVVTEICAPMHVRSVRRPEADGRSHLQSLSMLFPKVESLAKLGACSVGYSSWLALGILYLPCQGLGLEIDLPHLHSFSVAAGDLNLDSKGFAH